MSASGGASVAWLLARPRGSRGWVAGLQVGVAAVATLLSFAVAVIALACWGAPADGPGYQVLAVALAGILVLPIATLSAAAARLSARGREERLATLRLLGASAARVRVLAVTEATASAVIGVLGGTAGALLLPLALPAFEALPLLGVRISPAELALPLWLFLAVPVALVSIAAVSGLLGLRAVVVSPLGVRARAAAPRLSWVRPVLAVSLVTGAALLTRAVSPDWGVAAAVAGLGVALIAAMAVLGVLGPTVVLWIARGRARRAADPAKLIALRGVADDPKGAWRSVSVLALATFVVVPVGSLLGVLDTIQRSESGALMTPGQLTLFHDARTLLIALAAVAFLVAACQVGMAQVSAIVERRDLFLALRRIGMPVATMQRARRASVMLPAVTAVSIAIVASALLTFNVIAFGAVAAPLFTVAIVAVLGAGLLLVHGAVASTGPALRRELAAAARGGAE